MSRIAPRLWSRSLAAGIVLALLSGGARAAVIYDNVGAMSVSSDSVAEIGPLANSFSTGASGFSLADVKVLVQGFGGTGSTTVSLLSDNATSPGSLLAIIGTIADASLRTDVPTLVDLPLATAFDLAATARYWIELSSSNSTSQWYWSLDQGPPGVSGEFFFSRDTVTPNSFGPYQMCVADAGGGCASPIVSVAEPASFGILGVGLVWLGLMRRVRLSS